MKKIITTLAFIALSTVSAKAIELPGLGMFSLTAGIASNSGVFGASAKETNLPDNGVINGTAVSQKNKLVANGHIKEESGVFTDSFSSQFIEIGIGEFISVGYEHTPDSITTPTNVSREGRALEKSTFVDFDDLNTTYLKINFPFVTGLYGLIGTVESDLKIKKTGGSTSTYDNKSIDGDVTAIGYQKYIGDTGFGIRAQASYMEFGNVSTSSGNAQTTAGGGNNTIDADELAGASAKVALTYTIGRN